MSTLPCRHAGRLLLAAATLVINVALADSSAHAHEDAVPDTGTPEQSAAAIAAKEPPSADVQTSARRMIASCEAYAAEKKLTPLSIAVVDESGALLEFSRQAGASAITGEAAMLKAKTAAKVQVPTSVLATAAADNPATRDFYALLQLATLPGGWPFTDGDGKVRGAIGVSGALPEDDAACARRGAEANP